MDLDDSFLEKVLQRDRSRREYLNKKLESINTVSKKRTALTEEQPITNSDDDPPKESPKRQRLSLENPLEDEKENVRHSQEAFVPYKSVAAGRGLAALKKKDTSAGADNVCQPISEVNTPKTYVFSTNGSDLCSARKTRLANLAAHINEWEDDQHRPTLATNSVTSSPNKVPTFSMHNVSSSVNNTPCLKPSEMHVGFTKGLCKSIGISRDTLTLTSAKQRNIDVSCGSNRQAKQGVWDQAVRAALELVKPPMQTSSSVGEARRFPADGSKPKEGNTDEGKADTIQSNSHAIIKAPADLNKSLDPAELPLSARKALFERALLGGAVKSAASPFEPKLSVAQRAAMFETASKNNARPTPTGANIPKHLSTVNSSPDKPVTLPPVQGSPAKNGYSSPQKLTKQLSHESPAKRMLPPPVESPLSPSKGVGFHTRLVQQQLVEKATNSWQQKDSVAKATEERKQEISSLVNHWEKLSSSSSAENANSEEEPHAQQLPGVPTREGYESDEELADCESEFESEYNERASEVSERVGLEEEYEDSMLSDHEDVPEVFNPKRFSLEAGLANYDVDTDSVPATTDDETGSQGSHCWQKKDSQSSAKSSISEGTTYSVSKSLSCTSASSAGSYGRDVSSDGGGEASSGQPDTPLQYTVSFYRKQRQETRTPPLQTIVRKEQVLNPVEEEDQGQIIQDRIKSLQEEILRQQTVIGQTSQALNLCQATAEFSGSSEQVEGERLLLIATQKRQACTNEIQRLKAHGAQGENISDGTGTLTITDLQLPLKREFIAAQLEGKIDDAVHCFLCLIRHGAQVIVTQMVSTEDKIADGALCFTNHIKLQNLPPNFSVVFEVYALQTKKENLPHDKKYHIKREHSKMRLTPKGRKADSKLLLPAISSPGGPNAVRSPNFGVIGFTRFTLQSCGKKCFALSKVPFTSPLEGILKVKLQLHAEHKVKEKGFLTMFEDISGLGAWQRRWCMLNAHHLAYWKYPDDEYKKEPIGVLNLKQCITAEVKQVAWDICARPNTFELTLVRPQAEGDRNTLISKSANSLTTTKHLLSADTREERALWCSKLNEALANARKWDHQAMRPVEARED